MKTNIKQQYKKLAAHTRRLMDSGEFVREKSGREYYTVMSLLLIDGIFQAAMRYETVQDRVSKFADEHPKAKTVREFKSLIGRKPLWKILKWKGRKPKTLECLIHLLIREKVDNVRQFHKWVGVCENRDKLLEVCGIGEKTVDYLKLLAGHDDTTAVDRHIRGFVREAGVKCKRDEIQEIVRCAARELKMKVSDYDASIWHYMRNKKKRG